jgi:plastocyanin
MHRRFIGLALAAFGAAVLVAAGADDAAPPSAARKPEPHKYALLISASQNKHRQQILQEAHKALLANDFQPENVRVLAGDRATWENTERVANELYEKTQENDMFVLYLAGHGTLLGEEGQKESIFLLWGNTAVKAARLASLFAALEPLSGFVVFDAPYSVDFSGAFKETSLVAIAPSKENDAKGCATFSLVLWKELQRSGKERKQTFLNSLEGAYMVAEAHAKRRSEAAPLLQAPYDPENFFLWLDPRDQFREDERRRLASPLRSVQEEGVTRAAVQAAADRYDNEARDTGQDFFEEDINLDEVVVVE